MYELVLMHESFKHIDLILVSYVLAPLTLDHALTLESLSLTLLLALALDHTLTLGSLGLRLLLGRAPGHTLTLRSLSLKPSMQKQHTFK